MTESHLLHELVSVAAERSPESPALSYGKAAMDYAQLQSGVRAFASGLRALGLQRSERVGIWLEKRIETVIASFGAPCAGGVFVPMNPLLKPEQVAFIAQDCNVRVLVTSPERLQLLLPVLADCHDLRHVVLTESPPQPLSLPEGMELHALAGLHGRPAGRRAPRGRPRHGGDSLHQRLDRQTEGRGAESPQHGGRCEERGLLSRAIEPPTVCWRRCR